MSDFLNLLRLILMYFSPLKYQPNIWRFFCHRTCSGDVWLELFCGCRVPRMIWCILQQFTNYQNNWIELEMDGIAWFLQKQILHFTIEMLRTKLTDIYLKFTGCNLDGWRWCWNHLGCSTHCQTTSHSRQGESPGSFPLVQFNMVAPTLSMCVFSSFKW